MVYKYINYIIFFKYDIFKLMKNIKKILKSKI